MSKKAPVGLCIFHGEFFMDDPLSECPACQEGDPNNPIIISEDGIYINDDDGEIVSWIMQEWIDDPEVVISIASAICMRLQEGGNERLRLVIQAENA